MSVVYPYNQEPEKDKNTKTKSNVILEIVCFITGFLIGLTV